MRNFHKCRVYKDRWYGYWTVHCYLSDERIGNWSTYNAALQNAIRHHKGLPTFKSICS